jgi:hypothetical protein
MKRLAGFSTLMLAFALAAPAGAVKIDGVLVEPTNPTTRDVIEITVVGSENFNCPISWSAPKVDPVDGTAFHLRGDVGPECPFPRDTTFRETFALPPQAVGEYVIKVSIRDPFSGGTIAAWDEIVLVREPDSSLTLREDNAFHVAVEWKNPRDGNQGAGYARRLAEDSGAFWYFGSNNLETTIKILDGRPINGHWWVFIANMTDLEVKATVLYNRNDCLVLPVFPPDCPTKTYTQAAGTSRNFIDVEAFAD